MFQAISGNPPSSLAVISTHRCQSNLRRSASRFGSHTLRGYGGMGALSPVLIIFPDLVVSFLASLKPQSLVNWIFIWHCDLRSSNKPPASIIGQIIEGLYSI